MLSCKFNRHWTIDSSAVDCRSTCFRYYPPLDKKGSDSNGERMYVPFMTPARAAPHPYYTQANPWGQTVTYMGAPQAELFALARNEIRLQLSK